MATLNNLFRKLLNVNTAVFNNMRIETDQDGVTSVTVTARVKRKESHRCPVCGRKCSGYDQGGRKVRRWRALDMCGLFLFIETSQERILCSEHGVQYPAVPWAYEGSRFTRDFDRTAAWLACQLSRKAVAEYLRIDWETVGRCISRARKDIEPDLKKRLDGLVHIGIDETSYRKGHKYITVIVDHDRNRVVWLHDGHGKSVLEKFYEELTEEQRKSIKVVTGDGARWITECVEKYTPDCVRCMDSFHVVEWANEALDEVRIKAWRDATAIVKALEEKLGNGEKAMMIFADENMRLALCTIHLPLKDVAPAITQEKVSESIRLLHESLRKDFGRERPLIAVLSLNPHAGDGGVIGTEESEAIAPAIEDAIAHKIMAFGPFAADGFFGSGEWKKYDGVLAMYHDQGLAPFKLLSGTSGVNFTAGLPYVRTSPDHGTGYDIAGKNLADPTSLRNAIYTGIDIYRRRRDYLRAKAHPLRKQLQDKGGDRVKLDLTKDPTPADEPLGI